MARRSKQAIADAVAERQQEQREVEAEEDREKLRALGDDEDQPWMHEPCKRCGHPPWNDGKNHPRPGVCFNTAIPAERGPPTPGGKARLTGSTATCPWCGQRRGLKTGGFLREHSNPFTHEPCEGGGRLPGEKAPGPSPGEPATQAEALEALDVADVIGDDVAGDVGAQQLDLDLKPVTAGVAKGVACSVKLSAGLILEHDHFFMRVPAEGLKKKRSSEDRDAMLKWLRKKVRPVPDVEDIPRGAKAAETEALLARALTVPVDETVRKAMHALLGQNGGQP